MASSGDVDEARAAALKDQGNALLASKKYAKAIDKYTEAIALTPQNHILYSNRSGVLLELGRATEALADAERCTALAPTWPKGHLRVGAVLEAQGDLAAALVAYDAGLAIESADDALCKSRARVQAAMARKAGATSGAPDAKHAPARSSTKGATEQCSVGALLAQARLTAMTEPAAAAAASDVSLSALVARHAANVTISTIPGRGRAVIAARDLPAFSEVLTDVAAAWVPPFCNQLAASIPALVETAPWLQARGPGALEALFLQMEPFASAAAAAPGGAALPPLPTAELLSRVFGANGIGASFDDRLPADVRHLSALAPVAAMFNHDCDANCMTAAAWSPADRAVAVRVSTVRPVAAGEELCIAYVPRKAPRAERRATLRRYGFDCACARCVRGDDSAAALAAAEASGAQAGVEDTIVYVCPGCRGPVLHAASGAACASCGRAAPRAALREWVKQRSAYLARASSRDLVAWVLDDAAAGCVHITDVVRCGAAYGRLGEGWALAQRDPAKAAAVLARLAAVFEVEAERHWVGDVAQVLLLAGHVAAVGGDAAGAQKYYARAAARLAGEYGVSSAYYRVAQGLAEKPPSGRRGVEAVEGRRTAASNWVEAWGLPAADAARWSQSPVVFRSPPMRLPTGGSGPSDPAERAAFTALGAVSHALLRGPYNPGGPTPLEDPAVVEALRAAGGLEVGPAA